MTVVIHEFEIEPQPEERSTTTAAQATPTPQPGSPKIERAVRRQMERAARVSAH